MTISRRSLIAGGAALAGAGALSRMVDSDSDSFAPALSAADVEALDIPVMLSVSDSAAGELEILVGEQAIAFTDRALLAKLARAVRNGAV